MPRRIDRPGKRETKRARRLGRAAARLARETTMLERAEEQRLHRLDEQALVRQADPRAAGPALLRSRRALLIVNSKSGPNRDSLLKVRELVGLLAAYGVRADVRVKLSKSQARQDARAAASDGYPLVIAAGGDGTVEAVARGLVGTNAVLGVIPLGTYNNIARCLGIPTDLSNACALIGEYSPRPIDLGQLEARGLKKPRVFLEMASVGLGATLMPVGQHAEKGRLSEAMAQLPAALGLSPTGALLRLDRALDPWWAHTLLLTVSNTPLGGAALELAPAARVDDGLLDLCVYDDIAQAELAARAVALKAPTPLDDDRRMRRARFQHLEVHTQRPLAVSADSKLVGATPARFSVLPGAVLAIVGPRSAMQRPASTAGPVPLDVHAAEPRSASERAPAAAASAAPVALPSLPTPRASWLRAALPVALGVAAALVMRRGRR